MSEEYSASEPIRCPFCAEKPPEEFKNITHNQTNNGNLQFFWECPKCENRFTTIKKVEYDAKENHTLMIVRDENEVVEVIYIEGGEEDPTVMWNRAQINMTNLDLYELHGLAYSVETTFNLLSSTLGLSERDNGDISILRRETQ